MNVEHRTLNIERRMKSSEAGRLGSWEAWKLGGWEAGRLGGRRSEVGEVRCQMSELARRQSGGAIKLGGKKGVGINLVILLG